MATLKQRLYELLKEKRARSSKEKSPKLWKRKREAWIKYYAEHPGLDAPAGEVVNMLDELTPDGCDKNGKKVSFVERGKDVLGSGSGIAGKAVRISK